MCVSFKFKLWGIGCERTIGYSTPSTVTFRSIVQGGSVASTGSRSSFVWNTKVQILSCITAMLNNNNVCVSFCQ